VLRLIPSFSQGLAPVARMELRRLEASLDEQAALEAEPNDSWQEANPLVLGRTVYGGSDDLEYLNNQEEYKSGWDWFRLDYTLSEPKLVFFELDLPDRDVSLQLCSTDTTCGHESGRYQRQGPDGGPARRTEGRYSKFISGS
jgi:hypothetical protein